METDIRMWYLEGKKPQLNWEKQCYDRAYLSKDEAFQILKIIELKINPNNRAYSTSKSYEDFLHYFAKEKMVNDEKYIILKKRIVENIQSEIEKIIFSA
ncbi:hypothetical protein [Lactococcus lactis]|uniref:Uncharacterized protein n=1 Tax=Lactococcus lactis TaxID=1358 RepID=A0AAP3Z3B3_9LACT|nr:hypothetical protein [Lactococcus lactis]MDG4969828.1 hypothetical protein [Lactococcus lactis]MDG4977616.1 hypothetical protein [Lactococcus lactis]MDG5103642.1 hypothetical protein [Lactococcus lactis]